MFQAHLEWLISLLNGGGGITKGFTEMVFEQAFKGRVEFARQCAGYGEGDSRQSRLGKEWFAWNSYIYHVFSAFLSPSLVWS